MGTVKKTGHKENNIWPPVVASVKINFLASLMLSGVTGTSSWGFQTLILLEKLMKLKWSPGLRSFRMVNRASLVWKKKRVSEERWFLTTNKSCVVDTQFVLQHWSCSGWNWNKSSINQTLRHLTSCGVFLPRRPLSPIKPRRVVSVFCKIGIKNVGEKAGHSYY